MIRAVIFDFFGVICPDLYWAWLKDHVKNLDSQREYFQNLSNDLDLGKIEVADFYKTLSQRTGIAEADVKPQIHSYTTIDKELVVFITDLKKRYKIGLLSNSRASIIEEILGKNNLTNLFDAVVISEKVGFIKPQPEIFEVALKQLNVKAAEAVFIDDRESNVVAAKNLGLKGIVYSDIEDLKKEESLAIV